MIFKKCCYRIYQYVLTSVMHIIKYGNKVISKEGAVYNIPQLLERQGIKGRVLIITGRWKQNRKKRRTKIMSLTHVLLCLRIR